MDGQTALPALVWLVILVCLLQRCLDAGSATFLINADKKGSHPHLRKY